MRYADALAAFRQYRLTARAYGRPVAGGRGTYVSFPVPDRAELTALAADAARRTSALWAAHRGLS